MVNQECIGKEMKEVIQSNKEYIQVEFEKVRNEMVLTEQPSLKK